MNKMVQEIVYEGTYSDFDEPSADTWPPENVRAFQHWLESLMQTIPEQYQDKARIVFTGSDSDDGRVNVFISYPRPETEEDRRALSEMLKGAHHA